MVASPSSYYVTGGPLASDAPSYIPRRADRELLEALHRGEFCYVLDTRQVGKSSLIIRTAEQLRKEGAHVALLDLTYIGKPASAEEWYYGLLLDLGEQLNLSRELRDFWKANKDTGPQQRWLTALRQVALTALEGQIVLFVDEIDSIITLPFSTDEFFAGIRNCYTRRAQEPALTRLTFCLLGSATPDSLIQDVRTTPFNIGTRIEPTDFTPEEALPLVAEFEVRQGAEATNGHRPDASAGTPAAGSHPMLDRILYWTGGHPYLTQRLCRYMAEEARGHTPQEVDRLCQEHFLASTVRASETNLRFVGERMLRSGADVDALLDLYGRILSGKPVKNDKTDPLVAVLRLSGVVVTRNNMLRIRNHIYEQVFDRAWIRENMSDAEIRRQKRAYQQGMLRTMSLATAIVAVMAVLAGIALSQAAIARYQKTLTQQALDKQTLLTKQLTNANEEIERKKQDLAQELQKEIDLNKRLSTRTQERDVEAAKAKSGELEANRQRLRAYMTNAKYLNEADPISALPWYVAALNMDIGNLKQDAVCQQQFQEASKQVKAFDTKYFNLAQNYSHPYGVTSIVFSSDGRYLLTGSVDGKARLWNVKTGKVERQFDHKAYISHAIFSPNEQKILTVTGERSGLEDRPRDREDARLWNVKTGSLLRTLESPDSMDWAQFSPDGRHILAAAKNGNVRIWSTDRMDMPPQQLHLPAKNDLRPDEESMLTYIRKPVEYLGSDKVITCNGNTVTILDISSGRSTSIRAEQTVNAFFGSPDASRLITIGQSVACLWEVKTGKLLYKVERPARLAAFSPDSRKFILAFSAIARTYSAANGKEIGPTFHYQHSFIDLITFVKNGEYIATMAKYENATLWDARTGIPLTSMDLDRAFEIAVSNDARWLAIFGGLGYDKAVKLYTLAGGPQAPGKTTRIDNTRFAQKAQLLAHRVVQPNGNYYELRETEISTLWNTLYGKAAAPKSPSRQQLIAWYDQAALQNEKAEAWDVACEYLDKLAAMRPNDRRIKQRYTHAHALIPRAKALELAEAARKLEGTEALDLYTRAIKLDKQNAALWSGRALTYYYMKQYKEAAADCSQALTLAPKEVDLWHDRGNFYSWMEAWEKAIADYTEAIRLLSTRKDDDSKSTLATVLKSRALCFKKRGQANKSITDYTEAIRLLSTRKDDDSKSTLATVLKSRALDFKETNQQDKAIADYTEAIRLLSTRKDDKPALVTTLVIRGNCFRDMGKLDNAIGDYAEAITHDPSHLVAYNIRGTLYMNLWQSDKAIADFTSWLDIYSKLDKTSDDSQQPTNDERIDILIKRGDAYAQQEQWEKAIADFSQGIRPGTKHSSLTISQDRLTMAHLFSGNRDAYHDDNTALLWQIKHNIQLQNDEELSAWIRICLLIDNNIDTPELDLLLKYMESLRAKATNTQPKAYHLRTVCFLLYRLGRYPEGTQRLQEALAAIPPIDKKWQYLRPYCEMLLAMIQARNGHAAEAQKTLREAESKWKALLANEKTLDVNAPRLSWWHKQELQLLYKEALGYLPASSQNKVSLTPVGRTGTVTH